MKKILLSGKEVCKSFAKSNEPVLNMVNVDIYEGDFTVIMGASGAGKSTLLYALCGMDSITDGKVFYRGQEISRYSERKMAELRSREFGFVFQQTHLVSNLTLFENVTVAGYLNKSKTTKSVQDRARELLGYMHAEKASNRLPSEVSGGEAQRAAIARAMINDPGLLLADEPTGALNRRSSDEVLNLLTGLAKAGQSILMVTHDLRAAIRGSRLLYLEDGKILDEMSLPAFKEEESKNREQQVNAWLASVGW